ncbi:MAG: radical SAM protein [Candidatus Thorarchaeota archaeon]
MTIAEELTELTQKNVYEVPFLADTHKEFVLWFFTGSRCNLECTHCYVESGPKVNTHPYLTYETFSKHLQDALSRKDKKLEIYFTGGEPFINLNIIKMLEKSLEHADTTVLTNATRITKTVAKRLSDIQEKSAHKLIFRVSLDGPDEKSNDKIRGVGAFKTAQKGLKNLIDVGFNPIITAMNNWENKNNTTIKSQFVNLIADIGVPKEKTQLKILPPLRIGREAERTHPYTKNELFTPSCFDNYDYSNLQCSKCRMVSENGVWVCPILINEERARMGKTIKESARPFGMKYMACWTCRMEGMNCTN